MKKVHSASLKTAATKASFQTFPWFWIPALIFLGISLLFVGASLRINNGMLVYALDDPYIHLALAENIWQGHYGVNPGEVSAPSSSILWPFLLVPFVPLGLDAYAPLLLNLLATLGTVVCLGLILQRVMTPALAARHRWLLTLGIVAFMLATNAIGLIFTGMEHSLQVLLAVLVVLGVIEEHETGQVRWYLLLGLLLGPLVRYESMALTAPTLAYLLWRRHWKTAFLSGTTVGLLLAGFSSFLLAHDLYVLPTSVISKGNLEPGTSTMVAFLNNLKQMLYVRDSVLLILALVLAAPVAITFKNSDWRVAFWLCGAIGLHLLAGSYGWFSRYEIYIVVAASAGACYLLREPIRKALQTQPVYVVAFAMVFSLVVLFPNYIRHTFYVTTATNNTYEQQYHMHRFVHEYYPYPVAVNDLGWMAYRNEQYVLDLYGLASLPMLTDYRAQYGAEWIQAITADKHVELVIVHDQSSQSYVPDSWLPVAKLTLSRKTITPDEDTVIFYATNPEAAEHIRPLLESFEATLEPEIQFELLSTENTG